MIPTITRIRNERFRISIRTQEPLSSASGFFRVSKNHQVACPVPWRNMMKNVANLKNESKLIISDYIEIPIPSLDLPSFPLHSFFCLRKTSHWHLHDQSIKLFLLLNASRVNWLLPRLRETINDVASTEIDLKRCWMLCLDLEILNAGCCQTL